MPRQLCDILLMLMLLSFTAAFRFTSPIRRPAQFPFKSLFSRRNTCQSMSSSSSSSISFTEAISKAAADALGRPVNLEPTQGGGGSGGGGASTSAVLDASTGTKYFVKSATKDKSNMLYAEYLGVKEMADTNTIKCPRPIAYGDYNNGRTSFVLFEYLEFTGGGSQYELGQQLAKMHRKQADKFGFHVDNTIGATPQPNLPWMDDWAEFWDTHRLGHMLKLTNNAGLSLDKAQALRDKTRQLLSHKPLPSLLHGDLWGGNKGFVKDRESGKAIPCIFDPATYYGDREADVAMTYVFGGFNGDFYKGYNDEWPLLADFEKRKMVYNLYHILNHEVLFGGGYASQARGMIEQILSM
ncbi:hypothetical protein MPSEU_000994900 [Mayamaea pseudoterrestris]|nr:hypothetical protein MPSEU_000994900 [Mayamaea pseudoterrestris]